MTIYQIEAFITLATTLSFTTASNLIHTTQPNLSKLIVSMEQELEVQLFVRSRRDVSLTPAGTAFLKDASAIAQLYKSAVKNVKHVEAGIRGSIKVGFLSMALASHLPPIVRRFRERYPDISLELHDYTFPPLVSALIDNSVDAAIILDRELDGIPKLEKVFLYADDMCVVLPKGHRLNTGTSVDLSVFADEPFVMIDPKVSDRDYDHGYSICLANGFDPNVSLKVNTLNSLLLMIECGFGVSILARHMEHCASDRLDFLTIRGSENSFKMVCAWRRDQSPCVPKLIEVINDCRK